MSIKERIDEKLLPLDPDRIKLLQREPSAEQIGAGSLYDRHFFLRQKKELFTRLQTYGILGLLAEITGPIQPYEITPPEPEYGKWNWQVVRDTETRPMAKLLISHNGISASRRGSTLEVIQVQFDEDEILKIAGRNVEFNEPVHQSLEFDGGLQERVEEAFAEAFVNPRLVVEDSYSPIEARDDHWQSFDSIQTKSTE